ncbi:non-ribosomal peptide synthetase [Actinophytocola oryzae]|uniref:Amino acid adenylation domain-containing protein n=1 Tax=Actinophytocola oryzae TaxID=502181 RepID=A0A4R7VJW9_9PSEU|nr:non-ribosomal peptide synthetase [Actinophytocola oryzae]TDV49744.1 amino acid adenylation domain-containing protein [Actinophytocola oryzae]
MKHLLSTSGEEAGSRTSGGREPHRSTLSREELLRLRLRGAAKPEQADEIPRLPRGDGLPLSFAQRRLWVLDRIRPGGTEYLMPVLLRLRGDLDVPALRRALDEIVARHEVLRTRYATVDGEPVQVIDPPGPLPHTDVRDGDLADLVAAAGDEPLDLATEWPIRAMLARVADDEHALLLTLHHIAADGWSESVLLTELDTLYGAFAAGGSSPLPVPTVQYADFAAWQRERLSGTRLTERLDYWRTRLSGLAQLELPTDRPRGPVRDADGATVTFTVPAELARTLTALGRAHGATPFMVLLAAFQLLLGRHAGQTDVVVGSPVAGRDRTELDRLIGLFVNMVVLRTDLSGDVSFTDVLARVRETALGAYEHQDIPFERLVDELAPVRDASRTPLFQVVFQLATVAGEPSADRAGLRAEQLPAGWSVAKFDLSLALVPRADGSLVGELEYATALFDRATIERMTGHYLRLLTSIAARPDLPTHRLELLTGAERELLVEWSGSGESHPTGPSLPEVFQAQVARTPDAAAVSHDGTSLTYAGLNARANRLAHHLRGLGVGPETLVGVCLDRGIDVVVALLGVLKAGAGYLPLDPGQPADRLAYIVDDAGVDVVICHDERFNTVTTVAPDQESGSDTDPAPLSTADNVAYVIYTSGSTGRPKGVPVTHANVLRLLRSCEADFGFGPTDVWTLFHSYAFDFSVWELWGALLYGGRAVVVPFTVSRSPSEFLDLLIAERVTILNQTPSAFRGLVEAVTEADPAPDALALRRIVFGGEALDVAELAPWFERFGDTGPRLVNMYGITETTVHVTHHAIDPAEHRRSPIGRPLADLRVYVLDHDLNPVPVGVRGQLYVSGPGVARGYLGRPGLTADRFGPDPFATTPGARMYRTGDLARLTGDGALEFLGRVDDQVKIRGHRIEPGEVEAAIATHPAIDKAVVIAHQRAGEREHRLVAYVVPAVGHTFRVDELRDHLGRTLPSYMVPAQFVPVDTVVVTANGKVDRRALPDPDEHRGAPSGDHVAPRTPVEQLIAEAWTEELAEPAVGVHDNFFGLGGDSIRAIRVIGALRRRGIELTVTDLLVHQTIAGLARYLETAARPTAESVEEQRVGPFELLGDADRAALPAGLADAYPMSMVQAAMVYQMIADEEDSPYHNITLFPIADDAPFSLPALREAATLLAARHEILRTCFALTGYTEPLQLVAATGAVEVGFDDLRTIPADERDAVIQRFVTHTRARPFDVGRAPMLRFHVHQTDDDRWLFSFIECHAILDGWSHHSLITELMAGYRTIRDGREPAPAQAHTVRYADYVAAENRSLTSGVDGEFWADRLARFDRVELPAGWAAAPEAAERPYQLRVPFDDLDAGLRRLAAAAGAPLKSVLFAAHLKVLSVLSGTSRFHTGLVTNGRLETHGGAAVCGMHLNTLPIGVELTGATWTELVRQVLAEEVAAWPHRRFPLPEMQRAWGGGTPLVEVAFTYLDFHVLDSRRIESAGVVDVSPNEFGLDVWTFPGVLFLSAQPGRISRANGQRLAGLYRRVLADMAADPLGDARTTALDEHETGRLASFASGPRADYPDACVHELFERQVARTPDAAALRGADGTEVTYAVLNARANRLAHHLLDRGVRPESLVGVLLRRGPELVVALLAVLKAGAAYLPLDPGDPPLRLATLLGEAGAGLVLTETALADRVATPVVLLDTDLTGQSETDPASGATPDSLAYVIYTSGSTGTPKGVLIEHRNVVNYLSWCRGAYTPLGGSGAVLYSSMAFDLPVTTLFLALLSGQPVTVTADDGVPGIGALVDVLEHGRFGLLKLTPAHLAVLNQALSADAVRTAAGRLVVGGDELVRDAVSTWARHAPDTVVDNEYGPTETTVGCSLFETTAADLPPGVVPIGRPIANTVFRVLDANQRPVPVGVTGELYIGGAQLARGYVGRPDLTAARFVPDPYAEGQRLYRSGDLARYRDDGILEFAGRADNQVKIRGYRIELGEIEAALCGHPAVAKAAVRVAVMPGGDRDLVGYLVRAEGATIDPAGVRDWLSTRLPGHLVPPSIMVLDALPLTRNGKVDAAKLPEPADPRAGAAYLAPRTATEGILAAALAEALGRQKVGIDEAFTDLGGHSMTVMRVILKLRDEHGISVPFRAFYQHRTVAELARAIDPGARDGLRSTVVADRDGDWSDALLWFRRSGTRPPLFCVYPGGGQWYVHLAECIDADRPVAALEWPGLHRDAPSPQSIGSVAELFVAEVRAVRPTGPYHLLGWCGAGPVTLEMAHRLRRDGEQVTLALLDPALDSHTRSNLWEETAMFVRGETVLEKLDQARTADEITALQREFLEVLDYIIDEGGKDAPLPGDTFWAGRLRVWRELTQAMLGYRQRPTPGHLHLLVGDELAGGGHDVSCGQTVTEYLDRWGELTPGGLEVHRVGGDHLGVLRRPHVDDLARLLTRLMAASETRQDTQKDVN